MSRRHLQHRGSADVLGHSVPRGTPAARHGWRHLFMCPAVMGDPLAQEHQLSLCLALVVGILAATAMTPDLISAAMLRSTA